MAIEAQLYSENIPLHIAPDLLMDNACGFNNINNNNNNNFYFIPPNQVQQQHHHHHHQQQQLQNKRQKVEPSFVQVDQFHNFTPPQGGNRFLMENSMMNHQEPVAIPQTIAAQFQNQRMEIDRFITLQNERLRLVLQEQRKQQLALFLHKYEENTRFLFNQKDEQIAKEMNRTMELQEFLKRKEIENQTWQKLVKEKEAMVASLNSTIERLRGEATASSDDAESGCCGGVLGETTGQKTRRSCKCCNDRESCVIMLPCRHLSSCKECEPFLDFCPLCRMVKKGTIHALM